MIRTMEMVEWYHIMLAHDQPFLLHGFWSRSGTRPKRWQDKHFPMSFIHIYSCSCLFMFIRWQDKTRCHFSMFVQKHIVRGLTLLVFLGQSWSPRSCCARGQGEALRAKKPMIWDPWGLTIRILKHVRRSTKQMWNKIKVRNTVFDWISKKWCIYNDCYHNCKTKSQQHQTPKLHVDPQAWPNPWVRPVGQKSYHFSRCWVRPGKTRWMSWWRADGQLANICFSVPKVGGFNSVSTKARHTFEKLEKQ